MFNRSVTVGSRCRGSVAYLQTRSRISCLMESTERVIINASHKVGSDKPQERVESSPTRGHSQSAAGSCRLRLLGGANIYPRSPAMGAHTGLKIAHKTPPRALAMRTHRPGQMADRTPTI